jgi:pyruvate dehydrogenase E2 component (dihydrolipoamide acetyltransferase)
MAEITMPRLSDTMSEGAVGRWLKKPGDAVTVDEVIAEIETDKATMELVAFESGTLQEITIEEGKVVPIGTVIGIIGSGAVKANGSGGAASTPVAAKPAEVKADETKTAAVAAVAAAVAAAPAAQADAGAGAAAETGAAAKPAASAAASADGQRIKASPVARRVAEEKGIDLAEVEGTGPNGRILRANVEAFTPRKGGAQPAAGTSRPTLVPSPATAAVAADSVTPMTRMRKAIAKAMTDSKPGVPHIYLTCEIDMGAAQTLRKQIADSGAAEVKISPNDLIVKAVAKALVKFPQINASYVTTPDNQPAVGQHAHVNVSVAVATDQGLLAPVVHDADKKSVSAIAAEIRELAGRAREGKVKAGDLDGATFQTSNLGMFGITEFVSIITLPQSASLAIGEIRQTPVVRDGQIVVGEIMNVTLSVDHRVADGAAGAQFLQELTRLLEAPLSLLV